MLRTVQTNSHPKTYSPAVEAMLSREKKLITPKLMLWVVIAIAVLAYAAKVSDISLLELIEGTGNMVRQVQKYFPAEFNDWRAYLAGIIETVGMGIWSSLIAALVSAPLAILASENMCPAWVVQPVRRFLDSLRSIHEMVFALIFVTAVGLGPFAGVLALFVNTTGNLGKLFSEAVEAIDPGPVEGIRATGASWFQEVSFGVIPQVLPLWTSFTLYRFEANVRSAAVLGIVGAGGIGTALFQSIRSFKYGKVCAILIFLILAVGIIDMLSSKIRQRLI